MEKISTSPTAAISRRTTRSLEAARREEPPIKTNCKALVAAYFLENDEGTCADVNELTAVLPGTINNIVKKFCADGLLNREQIATQIGIPRILYFPDMKVEEYGDKNHPVYKGLRYFTVGFHIDKSTTPWTCRRNER